jgi:hypothetical protein
MTRLDETAPDPAALLKLARQALSSAEYRKKFAMADFWGPAEFYPPQLNFFAAGAKYHQRLIRGGNQVGKSFSAAFEASLHMSGAYPSWWCGKRFTKPTRGWVIGPTAQLVRDGPQRQLCSKGGEFGTGTIPLASFAGKPVMVPGGTGSIDTLSVSHQTAGKRDGISTCTFKSFEMRSEKMQSESVDWIWIDERCSPHDRDRRHPVPVLHSAEGWRRAHLSLPQRVLLRPQRHPDRGQRRPPHQPGAPRPARGELPPA